MSERVSPLRLEIFVTDVEASLAFYTDVLEFVEVDPTVSGSYRPLRRGGARISIQDIATLASDHPLRREGPRGTGIEFVLEVEDVEVAFADVAAKWPIADELASRPCGLTDFRVLDPDGYYWRITST